MSALPDGWQVYMENDPPFPNAVGVIVTPDGREHVSVRGDDAVVWEFIAALLDQSTRYELTDAGRALLDGAK
jgi:hypothetical protein